MSARPSPEALELMLASASPRRRALLEEAGVRFRIEPADVDETLETFADPVDAARELALRKARAVAARARATPALVLGADTIVAVPGAGGAWRLLGKPADEAEAARMLGALSGTRHLVATGVAVVRTSDRAEAHGVGRTFVTMRAITPAELAAYVASREWEGKAGGYAIQETADRFVTRLEGDFDNVVGLPVGLALELIQRLAPGLVSRPPTPGAPREGA